MNLKDRWLQNNLIRSFSRIVVIAIVLFAMYGNVSRAEENQIEELFMQKQSILGVAISSDDGIKLYNCNLNDFGVLSRVDIKNLPNVVNVDVTNLGLSSTSSHRHIWEKKYNSSYHWDECFICHEIQNKSSHSLSANRPSRIDDCGDSAKNRKMVCDCGYFYELPKKSHRLRAGLVEAPWLFGHDPQCMDCGQWTNTGAHNNRCRDANGRLIGCDTGNYGICRGCGYDYSWLAGEHADFVTDNRTLEVRGLWI